MRLDSNAWRVGFAIVRIDFSIKDCNDIVIKDGGICDFIILCIYCNLACTINGGQQGDSQTQGTCSNGTFCSSYGTCVGKLH